MTEARTSENRPTTQQRRRRSSAVGKSKAELPKLKPTTRTGDENKERAYVAASRRSDRSIEDRMKSALAASDIHRQRTGKGLKITREAVEKELMFEEEDDTSRPYGINGLRYCNASGVSTAREQQVNQEFNEVFGGIFQANFTNGPWPSSQISTFPYHQQQYAANYNTEFPPMLHSFASPGLGIISQPAPTSSIELAEPCPTSTSLPIRHGKTEFPQSPTAIQGPASTTLSHPYSSESASPPPAAFDIHANRQSKRKSFSADPMLHPSIDRPMKRSSISSAEDSPSLSKNSPPPLTNSPDSVGAAPDELDRPIKRRSISTEDVDRGLAGVPVSASSPEMSTMSHTNFFCYYTMDSPGGEMGEAEYLDPAFIKAPITSEHLEWAMDPVLWEDYVNLDGTAPVDAGSIPDKSHVQAA